MFMSHDSQLGRFDLKAEKTEGGDEVSLITLPNGNTYRMVHGVDQSGTVDKQVATIFDPDGLFLHFEGGDPANDMDMGYAKLGGYAIAWGDGDPGWFEMNEQAGDLRATFDRVSDEDFAEFVLIVLGELSDKPQLWTQPTSPHFGLRAGELHVFTAGTGVGKTLHENE